MRVVDPWNSHHQYLRSEWIQVRHAPVRIQIALVQTAARVLHATFIAGSTSRLVRRHERRAGAT